jgi:glycosyltransferase involved in cell wall biosynthesis
VKFFFDYQAFHGQNFGGISRVHINLINELKKNKKVKITLFTIFSFNLFLLDKNVISKFIYLNFNNQTQKFKQYGRLITRKFTNLILLFCPPDFFIPSYYDSYFLKSIRKTQVILIVHDLIHELFSDQFIDSKKIISNKKKLILASSIIITPSQCTKKDLLKFYPDISSDKVHVLHWASSMIKLPGKQFVNMKQKQILFVGKREGYKNFIWCLNAISEWVRFNNFVILCVGGGSFSDNEIQLINILNISEKIRQINVSDSHLTILYSISFATVIPSLYEGFCLPIVESMSSGCPVIYSESSCMPEIAGFAGLKFTENNAKDLVNKLNILLNDSLIFQKQIDLGLLRASEFSWEKTAFKFQNIIGTKVF